MSRLKKRIRRATRENRMRITNRQLRSIIRESLLLERGEANVTQIVKYKPEIREWAETLVDSMADHVSDKIKEIDDKTRKRVLDTVTDATISGLIKAFGYVTPAEEIRIERDVFKKKYRDERHRRTGDRWS